MAESSSGAPRPKKAFNRLLKPWPVALLILVIGGSCLYGWHREDYPYGATHRCNKGVFFDLMDWAYTHEGRFPDGGSSAASLAMAASNESRIPDLAGKAIDAEKAKAYFRAHGTLGPELCSWQYVPGLRIDSLPNLVLFWDTTGLTHNGMRTNPKRYEVTTVAGSCSTIPEAAWPAFLEQQRSLLEEERARQLQVPEVPAGDMH